MEGLFEYGLEVVGEGKDFFVLEKFIVVVDKDDLWFLWVIVWGGFNVLV